MTDQDFGALVSALSEAALRGLESTTITPQDRPPPPSYGPYHAAAAVLATFDRATLRPAPLASPGSAEMATGSIGAVLSDSKLVVDGQRRERWAMRADVRRSVLRQLGSREAIERALAANGEQRSADEPAQEMFDAYVRGEAPALSAQTTRQVTGTLQVVEWLDGLGIVPALPDREAVRRRSELLALLQPFYDLAGAHFAGRQEELAGLRAYVGVLPPGSVRERVSRIAEAIFSLHEKPPLVIWGSGGTGKSTLVGRFIWEHTTLPDTERFPWAFIDFDRPGMLAEEPLTLLVEAVRQLGIQYPDAKEFCDRIRGQWLEALGERPPAIKRAMTKSIPREDAETVARLYGAEERYRYLRDFASLLGNLKVEADPFLLVLDTFEQVQYRSAVVVQALFEFLAEFQKHVPRLRTVLAGRATLTEVKDFPTQEIHLGAFDADAAQAFLGARGVTSPELARRIYGTVGGSPLSLRLAAETWRRTGDAGLGDLRTRTLLGFRVRENEIQAQLFARILNHIHDPDVRKLAYPGLVLRRITSDIIQHVLAKPCGVRVDSVETAVRLFEEMRREVGLVTSDGSALVHRADVRRLVLRLLHELEPAKVREIEEAAVAYYTSRDTDPKRSEAERIVDRAEEIYHRLSLQQPVGEVAERWLPGVEAYLVGALEELAIRERAWLATRLGRSLTEEESRQADLEGWERDTAQRVRELLLRGRVADAFEALRARKERVPGSRLYALEAEAYERIAAWADVRRIVREGIRSADESGDRPLAIALRVRGARADIHENNLGAAREKLDDAASLVGDGPPLTGLEVMLHALALVRAEQVNDPSAVERAPALRQALRTWFDGVLDSELPAKPELMAWAAAEMGESSPEVMGRVLRLTGLAVSRQRLTDLALALTVWDAAQQPPGALADRIGAPPANSLTERWTRFTLSTSAAPLGVAIADLLAAVPPTPGVTSALVNIALERAQDRPVPDARRAAALADTERDAASRRVRAGVDDTSGELRLSRAQRAHFAEALLSALPTREDLAQMVRFKLGRNLESIALSDDHDATVVRLIEVAQQGGWGARLLAAARESNPGNHVLQTFAAQFGLASSTPAPSVLEGVISHAGLLDVASWRTRLGLIEAQVCRVEAGRGGAPSGTGFLVGPDLVMTAFHVIEDVVRSRTSPREVAFRFDYKQLEGGGTVATGTTYRLSKDWLVDMSEYGADDDVTTSDDPVSLAAGPDLLDYALLRLERSAGAEPVGGDRAEPNAPLRRWIAVPSTIPPPTPRDAVVIVQHPTGQPLKLALGEIVGFSASRTRLLYRAETEPGSGGAPCFDINWSPIGVHLGRQTQSRILNLWQHSDVSFGVPLAAIVAKLTERGLVGLLGNVLL